MNLLALNASLRGPHGHTQFLIDRLFDGARSAGAACESLTLSGLKINRCLGCNRCQDSAQPAGPDGYTLDCVYAGKDDVTRIFEKMRTADLLVFATPVYVFGMSSLLKILFERLYGVCNCAELRVSRAGLLFHHVDARLVSKPFVPLVCCDNLENETPRNVLAYFATFSKFMDAPQVGALVRNGGLLAGYGHDPAAAARLPKLGAVYAAYAQAGRELATRGRITPSTQRQANQEIVPVPFFGVIKRVRSRFLKGKFLAKAAELRHSRG
jgi:multimeric flavodoxin WrbA